SGRCHSPLFPRRRSRWPPSAGRPSGQLGIHPLGPPSNRHRRLAYAALEADGVAARWPPRVGPDALASRVGPGALARTSGRGCAITAGAMAVGESAEILDAGTEVRPAAERGVSPVELLWDLVFVFAITQVGTLLSGQLTWGGFGRSMLVL